MHVIQFTKYENYQFWGRITEKTASVFPGEWASASRQREVDLFPLELRLRIPSEAPLQPQSAGDRGPVLLPPPDILPTHLRRQIPHEELQGT